MSENGQAKPDYDVPPGRVLVLRTLLNWDGDALWQVVEVEESARAAPCPRRYPYPAVAVPPSPAVAVPAITGGRVTTPWPSLDITYYDERSGRYRRKLAWSTSAARSSAPPSPAVASGWAVR